jgi:hypothetical protein
VFLGSVSTFPEGIREIDVVDAGGCGDGIYLDSV